MESVLWKSRLVGVDCRPLRLSPKFQSTRQAVVKKSEASEKVFQKKKSLVATEYIKRVSKNLETSTFTWTEKVGESMGELWACSYPTTHPGVARSRGGAEQRAAATAAGSQQRPQQTLGLCLSRVWH